MSIEEEQDEVDSFSKPSDDTFEIVASLPLLVSRQNAWRIHERDSCRKQCLLAWLAILSLTFEDGRVNVDNFEATEEAGAKILQL